MSQLRRQSRQRPILSSKWIGLVGLLVLIGLIIGFVILRSSGRPMESGPRFPTHFHPLTLTSGKPVTIARGPRLTIVMLMASWCLYCAYEDKYVWPHIARSFPGVKVDVIDVSQNGGIGVPGPQSPAFTGHDNIGLKLGVLGMRKTMITYRQRFDLHKPAVNVYVDPSARGYWHVTSFPTLLFVNSAGRIVHRTNGALPYPAMAALISSLEH